MKKYNIFRRIITILFFIISLTLNGQTIITLEEVFNIALEENIDIKIRKNERVIAKNSSSIGSAKLLPNINILGGASINNGESNIDFATNEFPNINSSESESSSINAGIEIKYTVFNGLNSFYTFRKLNKENDIKSIELQIQIEQILIKSAKYYYDIAFLQKELEINQSIIEISLERYSKLVERNKFGTSSKFDLLSAEIDLNNDSTKYINIGLELNKSKQELNTLLNNNIFSNFQVESIMPDDKKINFKTLEEKTQLNNQNILLQKCRAEILEADKKIVGSNYFPKISLTGNYGYNLNKSNTSLVTNQNDIGFGGMINFYWNIFDGLTKNKMLQNAKIQIESNKLLLDKIKLEIYSELKQTYNQYISSIAINNIERRNSKTAANFFNRAKSQYNQGMISNNDFRMAQVELKESQNRLNQSIYLTKLAELNLYRISGSILK